MGKVPNTLRRQGIYHFRRAVPRDCVRALSRFELSRSLQTTEAGKARRRSRRLYLISEALFATVRSEPMLTDAQIAGLVRSFYDSELDAENQIRLASRVEFDEANREAIVAYYDRLSARARDALARNELASASDIADRLIAQHGFGELDALDRSRVEQAILRGMVELAAAFKARFNGDFNHLPIDSLLESPSKLADLHSIPGGIGSADPDPDQLFSARAESFRQRQLRHRLWENQTAQQAKATYRMFVEVCGDKALPDYTRTDAVTFKNLLVELPATYSKAPRFRGMSVREIVEATQGGPVERIAVRTAQRHIHALSGLWATAVEASELKENIFRNFRFAAAKRAKDQRNQWSAEQLRKLLGSPVWTGCASHNRRSKPGPLVVRDEKFWLPLIGLFSGMRQEEICQLRLDDLRREHGIWIFDVRDGPGQQLKNENARRLVPVHRSLIGFGLLSFAAEQRTAGHERLFHYLQPGGADDRLGHNFSKWFTRYRRDLGLYERYVDFHSFRHNATTAMSKGGIASEIIDAVTGHATPGETARYTKEFDIRQLSKAIEAIAYPLDLTHLEDRPAA